MDSTKRSGNLEVAHRFIVHDAEHTLRKATGRKAGLVESREAQAAFANYVAERFALRRDDQRPLELTLVGQEIEGGYLWVYQETPLPKPPDTGFTIENRILQDVVKGQVNRVNVRYRSQVETFVFEENTGKQRYAGPKAATR